MDTAAEGCIYSSVKSGLDQGLDAEEIRDLFAKVIENATTELKQQQIQTLKDAGVWEEQKNSWVCGRQSVKAQPPHF